MNISQSLAYIACTIQNHMTGETEMVVEYEAPQTYRAKLQDKGAFDPHITSRDCDTLEDAIVALAHAIREESTIGA